MPLRLDNSREYVRLTRLVFVCMFLMLGSVAYAASSGDRPEDTVARMYKDFAWEAVIDEPRWDGEQLIEQPEPILRRYFDDRLTALILRDRACVAKSHEICRLNFDPIWASQDPGATELKVFPATSSNIVQVQFRYPGDKARIKLSYRMMRTARGWRIADIEYPSSRSLSMILGADH
jgi:hypothetical protein